MPVMFRPIFGMCVISLVMYYYFFLLDKRNQFYDQKTSFINDAIVFSSSYRDITVFTCNSR